MSLGLAVLFLGILCLAIANKEFRYLALAGLGILAVIAMIFFLSLNEHETEAKQKRELAKTFIKTTEVELIEPQVTFDNNDGHPMKISGRVRNESAYTLEEFAVHLTFQDCPKPTRRVSTPEVEGRQCETIGDLEKEIRVEVPPSQSRDFDEYMSGPIISPKGTIMCNYQVTSTSAQEF